MTHGKPDKIAAQVKVVFLFFYNGVRMDGGERRGVSPVLATLQRAEGRKVEGDGED